MVYIYKGYAICKRCVYVCTTFLPVPWDNDPNCTPLDRHSPRPCKCAHFVMKYGQKVGKNMFVI